MISPSDFYRDHYFYKYINGQHVEEEKDIPIEPAKSFAHFLSSSNTVSLAKIRTYQPQHPAQNLDLQNWIDEHRILTKSNNPNISNGKGFDFLQECVRPILQIKFMQCSQNSAFYMPNLNYFSAISYHIA
jgi:hypothetical protein